MVSPKIGSPAAGNRGMGRKKGSLNKTTKTVKDAITEAFERAGGADYLVKLAKDDPRTFCGLVGKVIPLQVEGDLQGLVINVVNRAHAPSDK